MKKIIEKLMEHAEECLTECSKKQDWKDEDVECAYTAAKLYKTLQDIKMNSGFIDGIKGEYETSGARMPRIYYGEEMSHMRGRDAATGRYVSRGDDHMDDRTSERYYDYRIHGTTSDGRSMHSIKDRAIDCLEKMADNAKTNHERQKLMEFIGMIDRSER